MKNNCGVLAYDQLVGQLNGRTNNISLDTLAKIAQDNGFILFPMRLTRDRLKELKFPYIIHHNHHFECWETEEGMDVEHLEEPFYVLSDQCITELVVTENEARGVKGGNVGKMLTPPKSKSPWEAMTSGSTGGWASSIGPTNPTNPNDPKGNPALQWVGPALTALEGSTAFAGNPFAIPIAAGMGAAGTAGLGTGFQGTDKGWSNLGSVAGGIGLGGLEGLLGSGAASALNAGSLAGAPAGFMTGLTQTPLLGTGVPSSSLSGIGSALGGLFGGGGATAAGSGATTAGGELGDVGAANLANMAGVTAGPSASMASGTSAGGGLGLGGLLNNKTLLGLGLMGASAIPQTPSYQQPSSVQDLRNEINSGGTALGQQTQSELSSLISNPVGSMFAGEAPASNAYAQQNMTLLDQSMQQDMSTLDSQYAAAGMANSGEHNQARQQLMDKYAQQKQDMLTTLTYQNTQSDITSKMSALSQASGMDQNTLNDLAGLSGLDVSAAAAKYQVDANSINSLRQMLGTAGTLLTAGGMGLLGGGK